MKVQFVSVSSYSKICRLYQQNYTILSSKIFNIPGEDFSVSKYMSLYSTLWNYLLKIIHKIRNIKISISLAFGMLSKQKRETRYAEGGWYYRLLKLYRQGSLILW